MDTGYRYKQVLLRLASLCAVWLSCGVAHAAAPSPPSLEAWDALFYGFCLMSIGMFSVAVVVLREFNWLSYAVYALGMCLLMSSLDGTLAYVVDGSPRFMAVAPLIIGSLVAAYGFAHAAFRLESPHSFDSLRIPFLGFGLLNALLIPAYFVIDSLVPLYTILNTCILLMFVAQLFPPLTWVAKSPQLHRGSIIAPAVLVVAALGFYAIHFLGAGFSREALALGGRALFISHLLVLFVFVVLHALDHVKSYQQAISESEIAARKAAEDALALERGEREFERVKIEALRSSRQLAEASHDLRQPIFALREAMNGLQAAHPQQDNARLVQTIDYLDQLASRYLASSGVEGGAVDDELSKTAEGLELISADLLVSTVEHMFAAQAESKGMRLRVRSVAAEVLTNPLVMVRALSNLVVNALQHSQATKLLVTARRCNGDIRFSVRDNGVGMSPEVATGVVVLGTKSAESDGHGLGLAIVKGLMDEYEYPFVLRSIEGRGTQAHISIPVT